MRRARFLLAASGLAITGFAIWVSGCGTFREDCENGICKPYKPGGSSGSGTGGGGGGAMVTPTCTGDPTAPGASPGDAGMGAGTLINNTCGIFVRGDPTDDDTVVNGGTIEHPFKTIQAAINADMTQWIFVCSKNTFTEQVTIAKSNVEIYGGFDCTTDPMNWTWSSSGRTKLNGPPDMPALTVSGGKDKVQSLTITGGDASASKPGGSSIAVLVDNANPIFNLCEIDAGVPQAGNKGDDGDPSKMPAASGPNGKSGGNSCTADTVIGAAQVANNCGGMVAVSVGANGGNGNQVNGTPGAPGFPAGAGGKPGQGDDGSPGWSCGINMGTGGPGAPGGDGPEGAGATGNSNLGTLDNKAGFTPASGGDGKAGQPGQGGGGGGGVRGGALCGGMKQGGASGGSGGSGGCSGNGGKGGQGGGSSIALVSLMSPAISFTSVKLTARNGTNGGNGGDFQIGGSGGSAGKGGTGTGGLNNGCDGGPGGKGGNGGPGGGGRGGHSIGIAYVGKPPVLDAMSIMVSTKGTGGKGGSNNFKNNQGDDGIAAPSQEFMPTP